MSKKRTFDQYIDDEDRYDSEADNWGKYRHKDGKRQDVKKAKIRRARKNKRAARESFFDD